MVPERSHWLTSRAFLCRLGAKIHRRRAACAESLSSNPSDAPSILGGFDGPFLGRSSGEG